MIIRYFTNISPHIKLAVKFFLTVAIIAFLIYALELEKLWASVKTIQVDLLLAGIFLSAIFVFLRIGKWRILTVINGINVPKSEFVRTVLYSLVIGIVTPARVGEVICVSCISPKQRTHGFILFFFDRLAELCTVLIFAIPGMFFLPWWLAIPVGISFTLGIFILLVIFCSKSLRVSLGRFLRIDRNSKFRDLMQSDISISISYILMCILTYIIAYTLIAAFIAGAFEVSSWRFILFLPIVTLSNLISITFGGLGVREGLAACILPLASIPPEVSASALFLSFIFTRVVPGILGFLWTVSRTLINLRNSN